MKHALGCIGNITLGNIGDTPWEANNNGDVYPWYFVENVQFQWVLEGDVEGK